MRKTGNFFLYGVLICLMLPGVVQRVVAQDVNVEATVSETSIFSGERVALTIEITGDFNNVSRPNLPDFQGLRLLSNIPSTSRSFSFINGKTSASYSYSYSLLAQNAGKYEISSISIEIDGTEYRTAPISVTVIDRNASSTNPSASTHPDIFLRMEVSDKRPVTGQQLITDIVLFFKNGLEVNSYQPVPGWKAEGFWKEELENTERPRAESVILNGIRYRKARLQQFALFPTKAGELTISPYQIIVSVRSASSRSDPFGSIFGGFGNNQRRVELQSEPVTINAESLPGIGDAAYIGAVGSFNISRNINIREAVVGESIEIETRISGTGNIPLVSKPAYELPEGLEVYEPQENASINRKNHRISGSKTFTDIVIARTPGIFTLPGTTLAYFNPSVNRYVIENLPAITFSVKADPEAFIASNRPNTFDIKPVTGLATWIAPQRNRPLISYWWLWAGLVVPVIVIVIGYWQKTFREKLKSDQDFARARKAFDKAEERLQKAISESKAGDIKTAYNALHKALTGYIGDKLGLPQAGLSDQQFISHLKQKELDPELIKNVRMLLDKCSTISYAPETSHEYLKSHVGLAERILNQLKKQL